MKAAVHTLREHEALLRCGGYRPREGCPRCAGSLQIHDYRSRVASGVAVGAIQVVRFLCSACRATWQVLPGFLPRCLWRGWMVIEETLDRQERQSSDGGKPPAAEIPSRTVHRWVGRMASSAALLVATLATGERPEYTEVAGAVGLAGTRRQFVRRYAHRLRVLTGERMAHVAALVHRLTPGIRLM